jgi:hypothetical protein
LTYKREQQYWSGMKTIVKSKRLKTPTEQTVTIKLSKPEYETLKEVVISLWLKLEYDVN